MHDVGGNQIKWMLTSARSLAHEKIDGIELVISNKVQTQPTTPM